MGIKFSVFSSKLMETVQGQEVAATHQQIEVDAYGRALVTRHLAAIERLW